MKKFIKALLVSLMLITSSVSYVSAQVDPNYYMPIEESAYYTSVARTDVMYSYLNEVYLDKYPNLGFDLDYCSNRDIETLRSLTNYIIGEASSNREKADLIFDWVVANIGYGYSTKSFTPIDVFRNKEGICSGHSQLLSTLFKLAGIPSAIIRCYKEDSQFVDMEFNNTKGGAYSHEFVMAYVDGDWAGYDTLWDMKGSTDRSYIARYYFVIQVDGIIAYDPSCYDLTVLKSGSNTIYYEGKFLCLSKGTIGYTSLSTANLQVGGPLQYLKYFATGTRNKFKYISEGEASTTKGDAATGGIYKSSLSSATEILIIKDNSVAMNSGTKTIDGETYIFTGSNSIKLTSNYIDDGLLNGAIPLYLGQELEVSDEYTEIGYDTEQSKDVVHVEGNKIIAISEGTAQLVFKTFYSNGVQYKNVVIKFICYGNKQQANDLFRQFCAHTDTHVIEEETICNYCGDTIIQVSEVQDALQDETPTLEEITEETPQEEVEQPQEAPSEEVNNEVIEEAQQEVTELEQQEETQPETPVSNNSELDELGARVDQLSNQVANGEISNMEAIAQALSIMASLIRILSSLI